MSDEDDAAAITAEEYATWLTPRDAIKSLNHLSTPEAIVAIFDRLKHGLVSAVALRQTIGTRTSDFVQINKVTWAHAEQGIARSRLWSSGDITIPLQVRSPPFGYREVPLGLFGVRFDPAEIRELHPDYVPAGVVGKEPPEPARGPPVSDALLREWYALYQRAYPGASDTEPTAIKSAVGMFPGKYVARQKVRDLRGKRKPGRKPSESD
jgi:hypothetical protein